MAIINRLLRRYAPRNDGVDADCFVATLLATTSLFSVFASEAKQSLDVAIISKGLLRRYAPRNDGVDVDRFAATLLAMTPVLLRKVELNPYIE